MHSGMAQRQRPACDIIQKSAAKMLRLEPDMKIKNGKKKIIWGLFLAAGILAVTAFWQGLTVTHYTIQTDKISSPIRMAFLTDLHSTIFGDHQTELIKAIQVQNPDIILLAGDIADDEVPHDGTRQLLSVIGTEYPCYYVSGNHEYWSGEADVIKKMISSYGVTILAGETRDIEVNHQKIQIGGVDDPEGFKNTPVEDGMPKGWQEQLTACRSEIDAVRYSILLSHRPELAEQYKNSGFDLVLAGHSHGGQVRIPGLLNGLIAPNQGWFPKYAGGSCQLGSTTMIVSRGLSRSRLPRIFNPPELVIVDLK